MDIHQIAQTEWYPKLFRLGNKEFKQPSKISDKNVIALLKKITEEEKQFINAGFIITHLKECPSAKRFNIFNKYLDFSRFTIEDKTLLTVWCFLLGRPPLLKRCLDTLWDEKVLEQFPKKLLENCFQWNMNNNISPNCQLLKDTLSENDFTLIKNSLINAIYHPCQTNINSIFNQSIEITEEFFEKNIRRKFFDFLHNSTDFINIDFHNKEFYIFYSKHGYDKSIDSFISVISESKSKNIKPFIDYLENQGSLLDFFSKERMDYTYINFVNKFLNHESSFVKKKVEHYFYILNRMPENVFQANIDNIINNHANQFNANFIPDDNQEIFKKILITTLNSRLNYSQIGINKISYKNLFIQYCIFKEKEILDKSMSFQNNIVVKDIPKRL